MEENYGFCKNLLPIVFLRDIHEWNLSLEETDKEKQVNQKFKFYELTKTTSWKKYFLSNFLLSKFLFL